MQKIQIMEVCPRDGWQNIEQSIPFEQKLKYIRGMLKTGIHAIQIGSFVHPKAVPQMADTGRIAQSILMEYPDRTIDVLVPNLKGVQLAVDAGIRNVSYVVSVSESHNRANIGRTHAQSFQELETIMDTYPDLSLTLALSTAFGCPFEGVTPLDRVLHFIEKSVQLGVKRVELGDTIGIGTPAQIRTTFQAVKQRFPGITCIAHMHDTRNNGIINSWLAAENGADIVHTALGGLGGCPFAPGASGNTSTEDFVYLLENSGIQTGIDVEAVIQLAKKMRGEISGNYSGHQININKGAC